MAKIQKSDQGKDKSVERRKAGSTTDMLFDRFARLEARMNNMEGWEGSGGGYILLQDQKASGTQGGGFTNGAFRTRDLTTEVSDTANVCTLAANQFTLESGTYQILAYVPAHRVDEHVARLQNITAASTTLVGTAALAGAGVGVVTTSVIQGVFTITIDSVFEIQHRATTTRGTDGFGRSHNFATEIYTTVQLLKS